jgi:hypothetical protein
MSNVTQKSEQNQRNPQSDFDLFDKYLTAPLSGENKQSRFEHRVVLKIMRAIFSGTEVAFQISQQTCKEMLMREFLENNQKFPVKLSTLKCRKLIPAFQLMKHWDKTVLLEELREVQSNYSEGEVIGLVFSSDGDGLEELVIHNYTSVPKDGAHWRLLLPDNEEFKGYVIDPLKGFLEVIRAVYGVVGE